MRSKISARRVPTLVCLVVVLGLSTWLPHGHAENPPWPELRVAEVVTDPQTDKDGGGKVTGIDEYVELHNPIEATVDLGGWTLDMIDGSDATATLAGTIEPHGRHLILNPPGDMNNDVQLVLRAPDGSTIDDVQLGAERYGQPLPDGNAADALDEAVVLAGPWNGTRTVATPGTPTDAVWVEAIGAPNATDAFADAWYVQDPFDVRVRVHVAPNLRSSLDVTNTTLHIGAAGPIAVDAVEAIADGVHQLAFANATAAATNASEVSLTVDGHLVDTWSDGRPIILRPDLEPPVVSNESIVVNGTGHVRWVPTIHDDGSGLSDATLHLPRWHADRNQTSRIACPISGGGPIVDTACRIPGSANATSAEIVQDLSNTSAYIVAQDIAGGVTKASRALAMDVSAPTMPAMAFEHAERPTLTWAPFDEALTTLHIEVAEDATGRWLIGGWSVAPNATRAEDTTWVPGDARAYRLVAEDRAGLTNTTPWFALDIESVPVRWSIDDAGTLLRSLARSGEGRATFSFDRPLGRSPDVVLRVESPRPLWIEGISESAPDGRTMMVRFEVDDMPVAGRGRILLVDGRGADGAPMDDEAIPISWDHGPPKLTVSGAAEGWLQAPRHVVVVHAEDATDPSPRIRLTDKPNGVTMRGPSDEKTLTIRGEGLFEIDGTATDDEDNSANFTIRIGLDATTPIVEVTAWPDAVSESDPLRLRILDTGSGVRPTSMRAWGLTADGTARVLSVASAATLADAAELEVSLFVGNATEPAVLEAIHVAVPDVAGNLAEGKLRPVDMAAHGGSEPSPAYVEQRFGLADDGRGVSHTSTASPVGPDWVIREPSPDAEDAAASDSSADARSAGGFVETAARTDGRGAMGTSDRSSGIALASWSLVGAGALAMMGTAIARRRKERGGERGGERREMSGKRAWSARTTRRRTRHPSRRRGATIPSRP